MRGLFFLFVVMPVLELWLIIQVGSQIGGLNVIALVFFTAILGTWLLRKQGIKTLMQAQSKMNAGQMPAKEMIEGICLAVGGALLLTPGFITDAIGFACLIPGIRTGLIAVLMKNVKMQPMQGGGQGFNANFQSQTRSHSDRAQGSSHVNDGGHTVIEGEFEAESPAGDKLDSDAESKR